MNNNQLFFDTWTKSLFLAMITFVSALLVLYPDTANIHKFYSLCIMFFINVVFNYFFIILEVEKSKWIRFFSVFVVYLCLTVFLIVFVALLSSQVSDFLEIHYNKTRITLIVILLFVVAIPIIDSTRGLAMFINRTGKGNNKKNKKVKNRGQNSAYDIFKLK